MDIFSTVLGGIGALSSLFGGNSAEREANRLRARQLDLQDRALGNYEKYADIAQQYRNQGSPYLRREGSTYDTLGGYGVTDRTNAVNLLNQLLPQYANNTSLSGIQFPTGTGAQGYNSGQVNRTTPGTGGAASVLNSRTNAPQALPQAAPAPMQDPYALSQPQQEMLNQRIDAINTQAESAIQEYRAALAQQGMAPNPAGEARIREQLGSLVNQERNTAQINAQQERQKALQNLINLALGEKSSGNALIGQQAQGYGNVAGGYNQYAQSALGQADSGPFAQLSSGLGQQSLANSQRAGSEYESLGNLLTLILNQVNKPRTGTPPFNPTEEPVSPSNPFGNPYLPLNRSGIR